MLLKHGKYVKSLCMITGCDTILSATNELPWRLTTGSTDV
jgi:hypothetical protein